MGSIAAGGHERRAGAAVLHFAVAALSSLLFLLLAGLVLVEVQPTWFAGLRNATLPSASPAAGAGSASAPTRHTLPGAGQPGTPGGPVLADLAPATGIAGQVLTVSGTNLFSADGTVLVTFGGRAARTRCPSARRCLVVVPAAARPGATIVRMRTSAGLSNTLVFRYR